MNKRLKGSLWKIGFHLLCIWTFGILHAATGYQVSSGGSQEITEWSTCKKVTNGHASGKGLFVPTNSGTEWTTFYSNPPPGVAVAACAPACGGKSVGGYCWYVGTAGNPGQSCTAVCASHGGYNAATLSYAGSGGTNANCNAVVSAIYGAAVPSSSSTGKAYGCTLSLFRSDIENEFAAQSIRYTTPATTEAAAPSSNVLLSPLSRVCACNT